MNEELKCRTRRFAVAVYKFCKSLPRETAMQVVGRQLLRCGTSVGANYRSACRAKSRANFIAKMAIVEEEADETAYWLDLLVEAGDVSQALATPLIQEARELLGIAVASIRTARSGGKGQSAST